MTRPVLTAMQRLQGHVGVNPRSLVAHLIRLWSNITLEWGLSLLPVQSYVLLSCASFSDSCQKKLFVARALGTANACNPFLGLILRTISLNSPTFLPPVLVYVECSLRYHHLSTPCLTENITSQADISRRTTTIMQPLLGKVSRLSNSF